MIKDILFRAAIRTQIPLTLVSNQALSVPLSPFIKRWQVSLGLDSADQHILDHIQSDDLVITADIPFADAAVTKGALALNPRGELYSSNNIKHHLAKRNHNELLRGSNQLSGGPPPFSPKEVQAFAKQLDKLLSKRR
jgi:uncharacterized protein YaiI (UPF0178 family)